jgi:hypothetical protein
MPLHRSFEEVDAPGQGRSRFYDLTFGRGTPALFRRTCSSRRDVRERSLVERKRILRRLISRRSVQVLFADQVEQHDCEFFQTICARDLEASSRSGSLCLTDRTCDFPSWPGAVALHNGAADTTAVRTYIAPHCRSSRSAQCAHPLARLPLCSVLDYSLPRSPDTRVSQPAHS